MWRPLIIACLALQLAAIPVSGTWAQSTSTVELPSYTSFDDAIEAARSQMMADPSQALALAVQAEALVDETRGTSELNASLARAWWLQSEALTRLGRPGESMPLAQRALEQLGENPQPTKLYADILVSLGRNGKLTGEHGLALENYQRAYAVYQEIGDTRSEAIVLQSIGSIYNDAHQYDRAVQYFSDAIARYRDPSLDLAAYNNLGNALTELERFNEALVNFQQARAIAAEMGSPMLEARILNNIGSLQIAMGAYRSADATLDEAFALAPDPNGAEWARFLWGVRAQAAHGRGEDALALEMVERTFDGLALEETTQHFTEFHETAAEIYEARMNWPMAMAHFRAFKRLEDESRDFAASANAALVGAQFDFAEQELQIQHLRTQTLEQDLAVFNARARLRKTVAGGIFTVLVLILIGFFLRQRAIRDRQRILEKALYEDSVTGLPTRSALERLITSKVKYHNGPITIVAIEVERHGHLEGVLGFAKFAELEQAIAWRLGEEGTHDDVARIAPGLFGLFIESVDEHIVAEEISQIGNYFLQPVVVDGLEIDVSVTVGLTASECAQTGVRDAVIAVQQARDANRPYMAFNAAIYGDPSHNLTTMSKMLAALENGDMELNFQPKLNLRKGRFLAAEALSRWKDAERGLISPDAFIPQAEETGHIRTFTEWSLHEAVRASQVLRDGGQDIEIAVNISGALLCDTGFARRALDIVEKAPGGISFEITETAMMHDAERAMENFERWADAGVKITIDDYGSGFSSLSYLKRLPSRELKLDRMFVKDMTASKRDRTLVKSTIELAHNLGLELTAEGIENEETLALLHLLGADWAQGYLFSKALPLSGLLAFLNEAAEKPRIEVKSHAAPQLRKLA